MEKIDREWLISRMKPAHGEKARIARAMGIEPDKFSKILKGEREVQTSEIPKLMAYFGLEITDPASEAGFAEPPLIPFDHSNKSRTDTLHSAIGEGAKHPTLYLAPRDYFGFGIMLGDTICVDIGVTPRNGDLVVATISDDTYTEHTTLVRRYVDGWLISDTLGTPPHLPDYDKGGAVIYGAICGIARTLGKAPQST